MLKATAHFQEIEISIKKELRSARTSVKICAAWVNGKIYSKIFHELANRGVTIEVMYNDDLKNRANPITPHTNIGIYPIQPRLRMSLMHHKFCIIDDETLITGSFNWTKGGEANFENIIIIKNQFDLIKSYLHEFMDLRNYYFGYHGQLRIKCNHYGFSPATCNSAAFNLAILGSEDGNYDEAQIDVWQVCQNHLHTRQISKEYVPHFYNIFDLNDENTEEDMAWEAEIKEAMLRNFKRERAQTERLQNYFATHRGHKIHSIGQIRMTNETEHTKFGESPAYAISIIWRDMYYRKVIPHILHEEEGDISDIINDHLI